LFHRTPVPDPDRSRRALDAALVALSGWTLIKALALAALRILVPATVGDPIQAASRVAGVRGGPDLPEFSSRWRPRPVVIVG